MSHAESMYSAAHGDDPDYRTIVPGFHAPTIREPSWAAASTDSQNSNVVFKRIGVVDVAAHVVQPQRASMYSLPGREWVAVSRSSGKEPVMKSIYHTMAAAYEFAWKCGVIVIALALFAAMIPEERDDSPLDPTQPALARPTASAADQAVEVIMTGRGAGERSRCTLLDEDGRRLLEATYDWSGCLWVHWGDAFPVQPFCTATRDGWISLTARDRLQNYELMVRPQGVSGFRIADYLRNDYQGLGYSKNGELVFDPWPISSFALEELASCANQIAAASSGEAGTFSPLPVWKNSRPAGEPRGDSAAASAGIVVRPQDLLEAHERADPRFPGRFTGDAQAGADGLE